MKQTCQRVSVLVMVSAIPVFAELAKRIAYKRRAEDRSFALPAIWADRKFDLSGHSGSIS
jgi:hypothetical protein